MRLRLYVKNNKVCYSTSQLVESPNEKRLNAFGWKHCGTIAGRDMSGYSGLKTMIEILREEENG